ncbi:Hypothetical predicted protein [Cloeon dipterum]|uniref:Proliferation-associated SNF2-like protein n=2 Tax=Cloeon dipterum TaxID=197152 RepID=A0A8S1E7X7_9INSE|nr:Hypothetical predicted protein [Cloeon dipterum]
MVSTMENATILDLVKKNEFESEVKTEISSSRGTSPDSGNYDGPESLDEDSNSDEVKITPEMIAEEEELEKQRQLDEDAELRKAKEKSEEEETEKRLQRLSILLSQSEFFSNFIAQRIEEQRKQEQPAKVNEKPSKRGKKAKKEAEVTAKQYMEDKAKLESRKKEVKEEVEVRSEYKLRTKFSPMGIEVDARQPFLLEGACMRDYQVDGYEWLKLLYINGVNGILADEMGLGKTIQTIALICYMIENKLKGPFLIVAPLSTLSNWINEFTLFCPRVPVLLYHGTQDERRLLGSQIGKLNTVQCEDFEGRTYPVVVTSYEVAMRDRDVLQRRTWEIVAIDEGHRIKNHKCRLGREMRLYKSKCRVLLTGTPLQNDLKELWSLLNYLIPDVFADLSAFESWFVVTDMSNETGDRDLTNQMIVEREQKDHIIAKMHKILQPFMLRRMKCDIDLKLPPKKELLVFTPMTPEQTELYKHILHRTIHDKVLEDKLKKEKEEELKREILSDDKGGCVAKRLRRSKAPVKYNMDRLTDAEFEERYNANLEYHTQMNSESQSTFMKNCIEQGVITSLNPCSIVVDLRKVVNHPYLIQMPLVPGTKEPLIDENLVLKAGKMLVLDAMLAKLKSRGHKVLIFSQWRSVLDLIEEFMLLRGYNYCRLDGSTKVMDRAQSISAFNKDPKIFAFLLSTRAGGLGINLTAADTVIIYDSDWNPQCDLQAQDRCHRIGQTKPVVVYRLTTDGTIDRRMVERATGKRRLEKLIIKQGHFVGHKNIKKLESNGELSPEELLKLLNSKDYTREVQANGYVFSDAELNQLLDRSEMLEDSAAKTKKPSKRKLACEDAPKLFEVL